jgi:phage-related tail protein
MSDVKLQVLLKAVDQATRPLRSIDKASKELAGDVRATQTTLRELNSQASKIEGFRKTSAQLAVTGQALQKAKQEAAALAVQFRNTEQPTRAQAAAMEAARKAPPRSSLNTTVCARRYNASGRNSARPESIPARWPLMSAACAAQSVRQHRNLTGSGQHWRGSAHNRKS